MEAKLRRSKALTHRMTSAAHRANCINMPGSSTSPDTAASPSSATASNPPGAPAAATTMRMTMGMEETR